MNPAAFRELALAEMDSVYRMAMSLTRHPDDAGDLVQETYLKAFKAEERFVLQDPDKGVRPWLFKILHNAFYTRYHKAKREPTLGDALPDHGAMGAVDEPPPPGTSRRSTGSRSTTASSTPSKTSPSTTASPCCFGRSKA